MHKSAKKGYDIKEFILSILFFYRSLICSKLEINSNDSTIRIDVDNELNSKFETISIEVENIFDNLINSYQDISKSTNLKNFNPETAIISYVQPIGDFVNFDTKLPEESKKSKNSDINFKKDKNSVNGARAHIKNDIDQDTKLISEKRNYLAIKKQPSNLRENKDRPV